MGSAPITSFNSTIVNAFQSSLLHQLLLVLVVLAMLAIGWNTLRSAQLRRAVTGRTGGVMSNAEEGGFEPTGRRILRVGFGLIWLLDGILQAQAAMPIGLATQVIQPTASSSPEWVRHLANSGALVWNDHPIQAAVSSVWIQVGIGVWLLVASQGRWSQVAGIVSVGWGLAVWGFGEAFGGIFAPGLTILFGAPGAVLFYVFAGALVTLPQQMWVSGRIGRVIVRVMGAFFVGMTILQAWPGRGFWQGATHGKPAGTLVGMIQNMAGTPQPGFLSGWVSAFGSFDVAHGFAVNLFVVIVIGALGVSLCTGNVRFVRLATFGTCIFFVADWVLVEDFGFFGGLGTDPNSAIPIALVVVGGYMAMTRLPVHAEAPERIAESGGWREWMARNPTRAFRTLAAGGAAVVTMLGAVPMAFASTNPNADPILTLATNGQPQATNEPAPGFALIDQRGQPVSLSSLRGKSIAMTFLDPVCTNDCPIIGQEFREADEMLGDAASHIEFIAIVTNPIYSSTFYTNAFDRQEGLDHLTNWLYLTGSKAELEKVWYSYGLEVTVAPAGAMIMHNDEAIVIDGSGHTRLIENANPGVADSTTKSSFAVLLDQQLNSVSATA